MNKEQKYKKLSRNFLIKIDSIHINSENGSQTNI